jgi:hypothetical protein
MTQKDIYIISSLFLKFLIDYHDIIQKDSYNHILILYNHEIINVIKIQNSPLQSFFH